MSPVFAEVIQIQLDNDSYIKGESIQVLGKVTEDDSGLVTIVLRDPSDKFVLLSQAIIQSDNSFEKIIEINEKFQVFGNYNATAFVTNVTEAKVASFELLSSNIEKSNQIKSTESFKTQNTNFENEIATKPEIKEGSTIQETTSNFILEEPLNKEKTYSEPIPKISENSKIADFVDRSKDPQHYLDRYYNEPSYKAWFDRNYPGITIEEAVNYFPQLDEQDKPKLTNQEIIPIAEASSFDPPIKKIPNYRDYAEMGLVVGGLAILLGAVYGIKRKADSNSGRFLFNFKEIKRRITIPTTFSKPKRVIDMRLAKGEISIEEYEKLEEKLDRF